MKRILIIALAIVVAATLGIVVAAETSSDPVDVGDDPAPEEVETEGVDVLLAAVGSGTFWTTSVSILATLAGCIAMFKNKFTQITASIGKTATAEHLTAQTGNLATEIKKALGEKTDKISGDISAMLDNYKLLLTCFTVFVESAKINTNAKKEILDYLTGVKSISDNVAKTVADALKAIEEANAAEPVIETPKTDAAISNSQTMILG